MTSVAVGIHTDVIAIDNVDDKVDDVDCWNSQNESIATTTIEKFNFNFIWFVIIYLPNQFCTKITIPFIYLSFFIWLKF